MTDFTINWHWPQWTIIVLMALSFLFIAGGHGKQRLQKSGDEKGQPERYNAFIALFRTALWAFILICGGFFR